MQHDETDTSSPCRQDGETGPSSLPPRHGSSKSQPAESALSQRLASFTWANFTATQSTGGIAVLLSETPHRFHGLDTVGIVIFLANLVVLSLFILLMTTRFVCHPHLLKKSLKTPPEAFFAGSFWLTMATVIMGMQKYGVPHTGDWIIAAVRVLFWIYAAVTLLYNTVIYVVLFTTAPLETDSLPPPAFLTVFSTMLTGTVAATIAESQAPADRLPILVAGIAYQGLGWILSLLLLARFVGSMLVRGLGPADQRPGLFMSVGSAGYTIVSLIGCAKAIPQGYAYFGKHPQAAETLQAVTLWAGIFMWLFTFWLFAVAFLATLPVVFPRWSQGLGGKTVGSVRVTPRMNFCLPWWAMVFPNVGFTLATVYIGQGLESEGVLWVATVMTVLVFAVWLLDVVLHVKHMLKGDFM